MTFFPSGLVEIREVVVRVASARQPNVGVRAYVGAQPEIGRVDKRFTYAPYAGSAEDKKSWAALEAARDELRRALGAGELRAWLLNGGTGDVQEIPPQCWFLSGAEQVLRVRQMYHPESSSDVYPSTLLLDGRALQSWLDDRAPAGAPLESSGPPEIPRKARGRPTSKPFILAEFWRRAAAATVLSTLADEGRYLSNWLSKAHPKEPPMEPESVENTIRVAFRDYKGNKYLNKTTS